MLLDSIQNVTTAKVGVFLLNLKFWGKLSIFEDLGAKYPYIED